MLRSEESFRIFSRFFELPIKVRCFQCDNLFISKLTSKQYANTFVWFRYSCDKCCRTHFEPIPLSELYDRNARN